VGILESKDIVALRFMRIWQSCRPVLSHLGMSWRREAGGIEETHAGILDFDEASAIWAGSLRYASVRKVPMLKECTSNPLPVRTGQELATMHFRDQYLNHRHLLAARGSHLTINKSLLYELGIGSAHATHADTQSTSCPIDRNLGPPISTQPTKVPVEGIEQASLCRQLRLIEHQEHRKRDVDEGFFSGQGVSNIHVTLKNLKMLQPKMIISMRHVQKPATARAAETRNIRLATIRNNPAAMSHIKIPVGTGQRENTEKLPVRSRQ
jgi:hypothetical protein